MPFIHIKSLPFDLGRDVSRVVEEICEDFAWETEVGLEHVTVTWQFLQPGAYAVAGVSAKEQPAESHPVLIDLPAPDFNAAQDVERMLHAVLRSVSQRAGISRTNIFITYREAESGCVVDGGKIVRW